MVRRPWGRGHDRPGQGSGFRSGPRSGDGGIPPPAGSPRQEEAVATLVAMLASPRTANITGANYVIDGGLREDALSRSVLFNDAVAGVGEQHEQEPDRQPQARAARAGRCWSRLPPGGQRPATCSCTDHVKLGDLGAGHARACGTPRWIAPDLLGHGGSAKPRGEYVGRASGLPRPAHRARARARDACRAFATAAGRQYKQSTPFFFLCLLLVQRIAMLKNEGSEQPDGE